MKQRIFNIIFILTAGIIVYIANIYIGLKTGIILFGVMLLILPKIMPDDKIMTNTERDKFGKTIFKGKQ